MVKKYIRKVTRVGKRSLSVVIPAEIVGELKIREKQKLVVKKIGKRIVIEDWPHFAPSSHKASKGHSKTTRGKKK